MTPVPRSARVAALSCAIAALVLSPTLLAAQSTGAARHDATRVDTAATLASARRDIESANAAWAPAMQRHDAAEIAAAYADSGLFIGADGNVIRGRAAIARLYAARFARLRPVRAGGIVQEGLTVVEPTRIVEWGQGWLELAPDAAGAPASRTAGRYLTVWERGADGHWRITRNLTF